MSDGDRIAVPRRILPAIALSQLAGVSLWFATNAVMPSLQRDWGLPATALGTLTSAVQFGFIVGTLVFALLAVADRYPARLVFLACAVAGAACNALAALLDGAFAALVLLRFATGFFLAGIYPVGMKIAAGWYQRGLGLALGVLVGALVLGTAAPHGLRALGAQWPWQNVMFTVSAIATLGGLLLVALVPESPHLPRTARVRPAALLVIATDRRVRASAMGYFGHMWELYTFWVMAPLIVAASAPELSVSAASFWIIAAGFVGCAGGGLLVNRYGSARVASAQLAASGLCCLLAPLLLGAGPWLVMAWLIAWGVVVVGDSPQFSTLTAQNAPRESVGSVLTFVNSIGFAITIVSIELFVRLAQHVELGMLLPWLAAGPALGLLAMRPLLAR